MVPELKFEDFYKQNKDACYRAIYVSSQNPDEVEDLAAEAFARAWQRWSDVRRHPSPAGWIVRTALNLRTDNWRKDNNSKRHLTLVPAQYEDRHDLVDPSLIRAIANLPEQQRLVIGFRVILDLSNEQTAAALNINTSTVSTHLKRGLSSLREHLQNESTFLERNSQ